MTAQTQKFSVLQSWNLRPLPVALAHKFCSARFGDPHMDMLKRIYLRLSEQERRVCRAEFVRRLKHAALN